MCNPRCSFLRLLLRGILILTLLAATGWWAIWAWPRVIPSSGGIYFPGSIELAVPAFVQGDPRWKNDHLGTTPDSLHAVGCAVSSAAMVLASYGMAVDPGRLNRFLQTNGGYTPEGWMYWEKAAEFTPGLVEKAYEDLPSFARIDWNLLRGNPVIVRVQLPGVKHFVVIAGKRGWDYLIRDPGAGAARGLYPIREIAPRIEALRYYRKLK